jgi:histidinol-phosphate aminotransferase
MPDTIRDITRIIKLDANESAFGPSPKAVEAMRRTAENSYFYPDDSARELRSKLAALHGVAADQVLVSAGLTDLLGIIARVLLKPGLNAVTSQRSFIHYPTATKQAGGELIEVPMKRDAFDLSGILSAVNAQTRIVFLANPNNPTGTLFDASTTDRFLRELPDRLTVVLDEAYYDYAQYFALQRGIEYSHSVDYVRERRNVLVLRTFSKAHGLAGIRVGYALGSPELLSRLAEAQSTFAVSSVAQAGALAALDDFDHVRRAVENNAVGAQFLRDGLCRLGFPVAATWGNFLYCELGQDAATFAARMKAEGVEVRPLARWGAPNAIRVTVGAPNHNEVFLETLAKILKVEPAQWQSS